MSNRLHLKAVDAEDLEMVSARVQDAVARIKDIAWLPKKHRLALLLNRFRWEDGKKPTRVRAGLRFECVSKVQAKNVRMGAGEAVVSLLAITFTPSGGDDPGGTIELVLAGGGALRLEVECIEAELADLTGPWPARARPSHEERP